MLKLKDDVTPDQVLAVERTLQELGLRSVLVRGTTAATIQVIGDETGIDLYALGGLPGVESVTPVTSPDKLVSRKHHPEYGRNGHSRIVTVGTIPVGGDQLVIMAGPCAVYTEEQVVETARAAKASGAAILRGGAFKPRTSPHSFQGLGKEGLEMLLTAKKETGMPIVTEVLDTRDVELVARYADMLQIGTRNGQNFELLKEVGRARLPVLLKRHFDAKLDEWLGAAEYIASEGNYDIILCERGMKAAFQSTENGRFNLDVQAIPAVRSRSYLPVIVDPSHATGRKSLVMPAGLAAVAAGAHGLIVDIRREHDEPVIAYQQNGRKMTAGYCDYEQAITPRELESLVSAARAVHAATTPQHI